MKRAYTVQLEVCYVPLPKEKEYAWYASIRKLMQMMNAEGRKSDKEIEKVDDANEQDKISLENIAG